MAIFITGNTHADFERFKKDVFHEQAELTKDDCIIITGVTTAAYGTAVPGNATGGTGWRLSPLPHCLSQGTMKTMTF